jgi:WD40 repeat protein
MTCLTCGAALPTGRAVEFCPQCSFAGALGLGEGSGDSAGMERYELIHELGRGAMGVVWLAREKSLDRLVALKQIIAADPRLRQRLLREGQVAARLRHPNIVGVLSMEGSGLSTFLTMEFIEGGNLDARIQGRPLPPAEAARIAVKLARALAHAHAAGLLHRDVKPSNILMDADGEPRLADFGIAAPLEGAGDLTAPGTVAGTPAYLAPELLGGAERACVQSDVYSLGAVLYACLTGRPPFVGASAAMVLSQLPETDPLPPHLLQPGVPRDLETICLKCLEKAPLRRYATAALLADDLGAFLRGEPVAARPVTWLGRAARYCRRRPALALTSGLAAALLLALAVVGPLVALRLSRARTRAEAAEAATLSRLRESLLSRSRAIRLSGARGQRDDALAAATEAARIRTGLDARNEVIAALAEPEILPVADVSFSRDGDDRVSFDPDDDRFAVETRAGHLELRSFSTNRVIQSFADSPSRFWSRPAFSVGGHLVSVRNASAEALVYSDARRDPLFVLKDRPYVLAGRFAGYGSPEAFSPDGSILVSTLHPSGVSFHSTGDGRELFRVPTDVEITHLSYSPDGRWLAAGRGLRGPHGEPYTSLRILDGATGAEVSRIAVDESFQSVAWGSRSRLVVGGDEIELFRIPDGRLLRRLSDPQAVRASFGPGGGTILSSTSGGTVTLWDLGTARPLIRAELGSDTEIAVNRDCTLIAKEKGLGAAGLYRLEMSPVARALPIDSEFWSDNVLSAALPVVDYSPDGEWLATAEWGVVQLRDASGRTVSSEPVGSITSPCSVRFSRDGRSLLVSGAEVGLVRLPVLAEGPGAATLGPPEPLDAEPEFFVSDLSRDGTRALLSAFGRGECKLIWLDGSRPPLRWKIPGASGSVFLAGDTQVLVNSIDYDKGAFLELRDTATGAVVRTLPYRHGAHVHASADGAWLLLGAGNESTVVLRAADFSRGPVLPPEVQGRESQAAISADGSTLAFSAGGGVDLVRRADGATLAHLHSPQGGIYVPGLAFSPDGAHLALWWDNAQLTLWDLRAMRRELAARGLDW